MCALFESHYVYAPSTLTFVAVVVVVIFVFYSLSFFLFLVSCSFLRCDASAAVAVAVAAVAESMVCAFALLTNKMRCECVCLMSCAELDKVRRYVCWCRVCRWWKMKVIQMRYCAYSRMSSFMFVVAFAFNRPAERSRNETSNRSKNCARDNQE